MFPLRDENPTELVPYVTVFVIVVNVVVWLYLQGAGFDPLRLQQSVCAFGLIPAEITGRAAAGGSGLGGGAGALACRPGGLTWSAAVTSMFLHGSWLHLLGNMWFLWLFGNNIEDSMGHVRFVVFYLLAGLVAAGAQVLANPASSVPTIGASGAISGVMGAYLMLYPKVRIQTLFIFVFIVRVLSVPAWFILLEWFALQLLEGSAAPQMGGGVAYWAHVGGFVSGLLLIYPFRSRRLVQAKRSGVSGRLPSGWT